MAAPCPRTVGAELPREDGVGAGEAAACLPEEGEKANGQYGGRWPYTSIVVTSACMPGRVPAKWHFRGLGEHEAILGNVAFTEYLMQYWGFWAITFGFISVQLLCFAMTGDSFYGLLTGGVVESLRLTTGTSMTWHMNCGCAMWSLAFVQIVFKQLRRKPLAWIHRTSGRLYLLLWCLVVGPSAGYLSLVVGAGRARAHVFMTLFAITGMDTTVWSYYYLWRALVMVRRRGDGQGAVDYLDLHGRAMRLGTKCTMLILIQRHSQLLVIALRWVILSILDILQWPLLWRVASGWIPWVLRVVPETIITTLLDHNVILSYTTLVPAAIMLIIRDGPRAHVCCWAMALREDEEEAFFGSKEPCRGELLAWRLRVPLYLILRVVATQRGWIEGTAAAAAAA